MRDLYVYEQTRVSKATLAPPDNNAILNFPLSEGKKVAETIRTSDPSDFADSVMVHRGNSVGNWCFEEPFVPDVILNSAGTGYNSIFPEVASVSRICLVEEVDRSICLTSESNGQEATIFPLLEVSGTSQTYTYLSSSAEEYMRLDGDTVSSHINDLTGEA